MSPYQQAKQAKRQAQRQAFHAVLALPRRVQGATLFALWPEKLPKVVRHEIDQETRQAWLVAKKRDLSVFRHAVQHAFQHMRHDHELIDLMEEEDEFRDFEKMIFEEYGDDIDELFEVVETIPTIKAITVTFGDKGRTFECNEAGVLLGGEEAQRQLKLGLGIAIDDGGSIVVRQTLPLKAQVKNEQGVLEWKNQERVFGFDCGGGQWGGISSSDMKLAYSTDSETGKPLPFDPSTSMGDAKTLVKEWQKKKKEPSPKQSF